MWRGGRGGKVRGICDCRGMVDGKADVEAVVVEMVSW